MLDPSIRIIFDTFSDEGRHDKQKRLNRTQNILFLNPIFIFLILTVLDQSTPKLILVILKL